MSLFSRKPAVVRVGVQAQQTLAQVPQPAPKEISTPTKSEDTIPAAKSPLEVRSEPVIDPQEKPQADDSVITGYDRIPSHSRILTAGGSLSILKLPKHLEYSIAAIETGPGRAKILYDPETPARELASTLQQLRVKLTSNGLETDGADLLCSRDLLKQVIDEYRIREGGGEDGSDGMQQSKGRKIWEDMVNLAVKERATDIHIQIVRSTASIKIRVDGELEYLKDANNGVWTSGLAELAVAWGYNNQSVQASNSDSQYQSKTNLYAMIKARPIDGRQIALRYQSIMGAYGPKVVCRILNTDMDAPTLTYEQLGYYKSHIKLFKEASRTPSGLILFSGVTGSGKTTSQKTFIETHPGNGSSAIYSVEDPIEYPLRGVHQYPLQRDLLDREKSTRQYSEAVSGLMRADPEIVMIGEIRDVATASAAQQIVETGHMAIATVHAHLISGITPRLTDDEIGMSRKVLTGPNIITLLNYQALVPVLCPHCKVNGSDHSEFRFIHHGNDTLQSVEEGLEEINRVVETLQKRFGIHRSNVYFRRQGGCEKCNGRGTKGQTVVAEMIMPDRKWLTLTRDEEDYAAVTHYRSQSDKRWDSEDMTGKTVFEHTLHKVLMGYVDPRQCERFESLTRFDLMDVRPLE